MDVSQALTNLDLQSMDPEELVAVAYYALALKSTNAKSEAKKALSVIANAKASQWLLFALDISEHLNDHNVGTFIAPPANASRDLKDKSKQRPPRPDRPISERILSRVHPPRSPISRDTLSAGGAPELLATEQGSEAGTESNEDLGEELFHLRHDAW